MHSRQCHSYMKKKIRTRAHYELESAEKTDEPPMARLRRVCEL